MELNEFPLQTFDKLRYSDTDRQGHVNNAVFTTFLETGRVEFLYDNQLNLFSQNASFVIASIQLNLLKEINWPGRVDIGTGIVKIGNSSIKLFQKIFQNGLCVASADTVIVQVDNDNGKSCLLTSKAKDTLEQWLIKPEK